MKPITLYQRKGDDLRLVDLVDAKETDKKTAARQYDQWRQEQGLGFFDVDLEGWRKHLQDGGNHGKKTRGIKLAHIRSAYKQSFLKGKNRNDFENYLRSECPSNWSEERQILEINWRMAQFERALTDVEAERTEVQDRPDSDFVWLTPAEGNTLLAQPEPTELLGARDAAVIALLLCTGIREQELCNLQVDDLRQEIGGDLALLIRNGKGDKQRAIPYGGLEFCLSIVDHWLNLAGISKGHVFRGVYKGGEKLRPTSQMDRRTVNRILERYPIPVNGKGMTTIKPHDCRRTYAQWCLEMVMPRDAIKQNLGHKSIVTTNGYFRPASQGDRVPDNTLGIGYDLTQLEQAA